VPLVLKQGELYVTAALAGAVAAVLFDLFAGEDLSLLACGLATLTLRAGSLRYGWRLPVYRARPPQPGSPKR
ncbi:MAG: trimeric intracellular cation channel family protein, partial [Rhodobacter sp.]|nr:trimeric intracellular cation channel family protein [Rhodobacter sp.]